MRHLSLLPLLYIPFLFSSNPFISYRDIEKQVAEKGCTSITDFKTTLKGKLGKYDIVMQLTSMGSVVSGSYFYTSKGIDIPLVGAFTPEEGKLELFELDYNNTKTAWMSGELTTSGFTGKWKKMSSKNTPALYINLLPTNLQVKPLPKTIEGIYQLQPDGSIGACKLSLEITKSRGNFLYRIKTQTKDRTGIITFYRGVGLYAKDDIDNYIIFDGLKGDEAQGDLEGLLSDGEIIVQNSGNGMNYYVWLSDCDLKYIHLIKTIP